jgi:Uri superfamily endonuclease
MKQIPTQKGVYALLLSISEEKFICIGKLGGGLFKPGFYAYIGSAQGGLRIRIRRHLNKKKKKCWHIDYLSEKAQVRGVILSITAEKIECRVAQKLARNLSFLAGFGVSDCLCESHLYWCSNFDGLKKEITMAFVPSPCMFIDFLKK